MLLKPWTIAWSSILTFYHGTGTLGRLPSSISLQFPFSQESNDSQRPKSFRPPPTVVYADTESLEIGRPLRNKFADLVNTFPNGISVYVFLSKFRDIYGYYPDYISLQFSSMENMCRSLTDVFYVVDSPLGEALLFSAGAKGNLFKHLNI